MDDYTGNHYRQRERAPARRHMARSGLSDMGYHSRKRSLICMLCCFFLLLSVHASIEGTSFSLSQPFTDANGASLVRFGGEARMGSMNQFMELNRNAFIVSGRAYYRFPMAFQQKNSNKVYSFSTTFTFQIVQFDFPGGDAKPGGGMAFIIAPEADPPPEMSYGMYLGLVNSSLNNEQGGHLFAVEFDTWKDDEVGDPQGQHVGIDINSVESVRAARLDFNYDKNATLVAWIEYDSPNDKLEIRLANTSFRPITPLLAYNLSLQGILLENMFVGFSASTGRFGDELHRIHSWNFSTFAEDLKTPDTGGPLKPVLTEEDKCRGLRCNNRYIIALIGVVLVLFLSVSVATTMICLKRKKHAEDRTNALSVKTDQVIRFSYKELSLATKGFSDDEVIGSGGFGKVYRGILPRDGSLVAIKVLSEFSSQGEDQFVAEITLISRLRHKNLVALTGWCQERHKLLLVYEYMPQGALDKFIFPSERREDCENLLPWSKRYTIIRGISDALAYLHEGLEKPILHRDIKAANVLLDDAFVAKLGDFGFARLIERNVSAQSMTIAGTSGYIAPELAYTGRANEKSDVYSFGIVLLEIVCGRKAVDWKLDASENRALLLDWVWESHERNELLSVVDSRMNGEFQRHEAECVLWVALACCHPDPSLRPHMRRCCQIFNGDATPVPPPSSRPRHVSSVQQTSELSSDESTSPRPLISV